MRRGEAASSSEHRDTSPDHLSQQTNLQRGRCGARIRIRAEVLLTRAQEGRGRSIGLVQALQAFAARAIAPPVRAAVIADRAEAWRGAVGTKAHRRDRATITRGVIAQLAACPTRVTGRVAIVAAPFANAAGRIDADAGACRIGAGAAWCVGRRGPVLTACREYEDQHPVSRSHAPSVLGDGALRRANRMRSTESTGRGGDHNGCASTCTRPTRCISRASTSTLTEWRFIESVCACIAPPSLPLSSGS